jgi:integrase
MFARWWTTRASPFLSKSQTEARFFTLEEVGKVIAAAREPYKNHVLASAMTGIRAGETLGLNGKTSTSTSGAEHPCSAWYGDVFKPLKTKTARRSFHFPASLVYAHVLGDAHREAVEKVASVVFESVPKEREETKYIQ